MTSAKSVGRLVGVLLLAHVIISPIVNFGLLGAASAPSGFLANGAGHVLEVRVAVLLWFVARAMTLGAAIVALPVFRPYSERLAFLYLALGAIGIATVAIENVALLHMLSVSQEYAKAAGAKEIFEAFGATAWSARISAHFTNLLVGGFAELVFYIILFRFAFVPRAIAGFGLAAVVVQIVALAMPLLGFVFQFSLLVPMGIAQLALILWLLAKGFRATAVTLEHE